MRLLVEESSKAQSTFVLEIFGARNTVGSTSYVMIGGLLPYSAYWMAEFLSVLITAASAISTHDPYLKVDFVPACKYSKEHESFHPIARIKNIDKRQDSCTMQKQHQSLNVSYLPYRHCQDRYAVIIGLARSLQNSCIYTNLG